jgi:hypothetical protein
MLNNNNNQTQTETKSPDSLILSLRSNPTQYEELNSLVNLRENQLRVNNLPNPETIQMEVVTVLKLDIEQRLIQRNARLAKFQPVSEEVITSSS